MVARLLTADGIIVKKNGKEITFTMSGIADFDKIQPGVAEPEDFDAFWDKQKALLAEVPLKVLKFEKFKEQNGKIAYDVQVACAGERPVSGYLVMPRNAAPKSLEAKVIFQGYGATGAEAPWGKADEKSLAFQINAHGYPNGLSPAEYKKLGAGKIFDDKSNENPETAYFKNMILRAVRALEYVQTLPEWNGKDLKVEGGSQGGYQAIIAAGMLPDQVTGCYAFIPWCCDLGGVTVGRLGGARTTLRRSAISTRSIMRNELNIPSESMPAWRIMFVLPPVLPHSTTTSPPLRNAYALRRGWNMADAVRIHGSAKSGNKLV